MATYVYTGHSGSFKIEAIMDDLLAALAAYQAVPQVQGQPDGSEVVIGVPGSVPQAVVDAVVAAHDPALPSQAELAEAPRRASQTALEQTDAGQVQQAITAAADLESLRGAVMELADVVFNLLALTRR